MKIAVTGGAGQLGTVVIRRLLADRKVKQVRCIDLRPPSLVAGRLETVICDVRDPKIGDHLQGVDAVAHLAFVVTGHLPRAQFDDINVEGSKNVFRAAAAAGVKHIVYSSSVAAYGVTPGHPEPLVETSPRRLVETFPYSAAKYRVEEFLDGFEKEHPELKIVRFRPGVLVGRRMEHALGDAIRKGLMIDLGGAPMPVVWDEDVADAIYLALKNGAHGAFNLVADGNVTTAEAATAARLRRLRIPRGIAGVIMKSRALNKVPAGSDRLPPDPAWFLVIGTRMVASSEKARRELGWTPSCPTGVDVFRRVGEVVPRRLDRRLKLFFDVAAFAARRTQLPDEAKRVFARIHLELGGPRGGDVSLYLAGGRLTIKHGMPRPPTAVVRMPAATFLALLAGEVDFTTSLMTGRVVVDGEPTAGMTVQGMISTFRAGAAAPGVRGLATRRLIHWYRQGAQP